MKKLLFLHGFFASGQCIPALALRDAMADKVHVLTPDLPQHPMEALELIRTICDKEKPDLLVGNSCGSFYAQMLAPIVGAPALLGNPHFRMTEFLKQRIGEHEYKPSSSTTAIHITGIKCGDCLANRTRWHISSHCS